MEKKMNVEETETVDMELYEMMKVKRFYSRV